MATFIASHFRLLAAALATTRPASDAHQEAQHQWHLDRRVITDACAAGNPNFNRHHFITATEQTSGE